MQVRVRARTYRTGYNKAKGLMDILDAIKNVVVRMEDGSLIPIQNVSRKSGVLPIGQGERETRENFTINVTLTMG